MHVSGAIAHARGIAAAQRAANAARSLSA